MKTLKVSMTTANRKAAIILDNRDNTYYFDDCEFIRVFETMIKNNVHEDDIKKVVSEHSGVDIENIEIVY